MNSSTGRFWKVHSRLILGVVHGMKLSGCGIRDSLTLLFSKKGGGWACVHACMCVRLSNVCVHL